MNQEQLNELYYKIKININDNTCFVKQKNDAHQIQIISI